MPNNNQKKIINHPLKYAYERIWVPIFGRLLMFFVKWIEGKQPKEKPTYDLREKDT